MGSMSANQKPIPPRVRLGLANPSSTRQKGLRVRREKEWGSRLITGTWGGRAYNRTFRGHRLGPISPLESGGAEQEIVDGGMQSSGDHGESCETFGWRSSFCRNVEELPRNLRHLLSDICTIRRHRIMESRCKLYAVLIQKIQLNIVGHQEPPVQSSARSTPQLVSQPAPFERLPIMRHASFVLASWDTFPESRSIMSQSVMTSATHNQHRVMVVCAQLALAFSLAPLMNLLRSPTGRFNGKSTLAKSWTKNRYHPSKLTANVNPPAAC